MTRYLKHGLSIILMLGCLLPAAQALADVKIEGDSATYTSIQQAYDNAQDQDIIQVQSMWYAEDCNFNRNINVTITGGYNQDFTNNSLDDFVLVGDLNITGGEVTLGKMVVGDQGLDTDSPTGTIIINADDAYTNSQEVTLTLSAADTESGLKRMQFSNDNVTYSTPEQYTTTKNWTLTTGDGEKIVYVKYEDVAGNWSVPFTDTINLNAALPEPPTGLSGISGDGIATLNWTANSESDLAGYNVYRSQTSGSDYVQVNISLVTQNAYQDSGLTNGVTYYYVVTAVDESDNESQYSEEVNTSSFIINSFTIEEGDYTNVNEITLLINSNSNYELFISEDPLFTNCLAVSYAQEIAYVLSSVDGNKTVYVKFRNNATNQEQTESNQIILDTTLPQMTILSPTSGSTVSGRTN